MTESSVAHSAPIAALIPEIDTLAADVMATWKVPGAALAVVQDGKIALLRAFGLRDVEANLPVTPDTQFRIGSTDRFFRRQSGYGNRDRFRDGARCVSRQRVCRQSTFACRGRSAIAASGAALSGASPTLIRTPRECAERVNDDQVRVSHLFSPQP